MRYVLFLYMLLCFSQAVFAQKITGTVKDFNDIPVENTAIYLWDSSKKQRLYKYAYSDANGSFVFEWNEKTQQIYIEVSALDFALQAQELTISQPLHLDFKLERKEIELQEVVIKDEKAVRVKNDSTLYDPKKFLNGSERKVEDLIKKLPGMSVNEVTGEIKFKGKAIETVKLEDDDLFGSNYTLGTKNISVDMIEQVQAIENYASNPILSGMEDSGKVAINLKLKKQKTDYSGTAMIANGYGDKLLFNDEVTLLGISKKVKSFGILSFNNFGTDHNNSAYFQNDFNSGSPSESHFRIKKHIADQIAGNVLPSSRTIFNNTFLANYNIVYRLSKKVSVKNNFIFLFDKSKNFESLLNRYFLNDGEMVHTTEENAFTNQLKSLKGETKLTYNINSKSILISTVSISGQHQKFKLSSLQNNANFFSTHLRTDDFFIKAKSEYTLRISDKKAVQIFAQYSKNDLPQELEMSPSNPFITQVDADNAFQNIKTQKDIFNAKFKYLLSSDFVKHTFSFGYYRQSQPFYSALKEDDLENPNFSNDLKYSKNSLSLEYYSSLTFSRLQIHPYMATNFLKQNLDQTNNPLEKDDAALNAQILFLYKFNPRAALHFVSGFKNKTVEDEFLYNRPILLGYNLTKNSITSLDLITIESHSLGFKYTNLIKQFDFGLKLKYEKKQNDFIPNTVIDQHFSDFTYFQNPGSTTTKNIIFTIEKQIQPLRIYIKHQSDWSFSNYQNALGDYVLRHNTWNSYNSSFFFFSQFGLPVNIENKLNVNVSKYSNDFSVTKVTMLNNTCKLVSKPIKNCLFSVSQDYYQMVSRDSNDSFYFIDFDFKYQSGSKKWLSFSIVGKNLLNVRHFTQIRNSDYSYSAYQSNLLPRYFLLATNINF